jgi:ATP-dependent RNA helicase DDX35
MQALGIDNIMRFDWLAPPPAEAVVRGLELLHALGTLDSDARWVCCVVMQKVQ